MCVIMYSTGNRKTVFFRNTVSPYKCRGKMDRFEWQKLHGFSDTEMDRIIEIKELFSGIITQVGRLPEWE